ncbi:MAG: UPF0104 family protein [Comamonadaceae bacterium]|jgi:hypothetical protein|nr:UPF0104 family protein [Comamonadaceae bacterium]
MTPGRALKRLWPQARRWLPWLLAAVVLYLVAQQAREVEWARVWASLRELPLGVVSVSAALALCAHTLFSCYDLIGRRLARARITRARTLTVAAIAYAFNLNFGALIGGVGMRLRLYTRAGLSAGTVGQMVTHSFIANWLGWCWVLGTVLVCSPPPLRIEGAPGAGALRALGAVLLLVAVGYHALCLFGRRTALRWRGHTLPLAGARVALVQAAMGATVWMLMALSLWNLLQGRAPYPLVLGALLLAGVAGALTHVPSGLGVLESVVAAALAGVVPLNEALAAVLAYRAAHYLMPLALALPAYAWSEWRPAARSGDAPRPPLDVPP